MTNKTKIYRVCPTLDLCKDVEAISENQAIEKINEEFKQFINWKSFYLNGYSDLNCDFTYITDQWNRGEQ
jgi:hypothetical protein